MADNAMKAVKRKSSVDLFTAAQGAFGGSRTKASACGSQGSLVEGGACSDLLANFETYQKQNESYAESVKCKQDELAGLVEDLQCLQEQATAFQNDVGRLKDLYVQGLTNERQKVAELNTYIEDRAAQGQDAEQTLKGGDTAGPGLEKLLDQATQLKDLMAGSVPTFQMRYDQIRQNEVAFGEVMNIAAAAKAEQCFEKEVVSASATCQGSSGLMSFRDLVLCRVEQYSKTTYDNNTGKHVVETSGRAAMDVKAARNRAYVESIFNEIKTAMPSNDMVPDDPKALKEFTSQKRSVTTMAQLRAKFEKKLKGVQIGGFESFASVVMDRYRYCFDKAAREVNQSRASETGDIGRLERTIQTDKEGLNKQVDVALNKYDEQFIQLRTNMTKIHMPYTSTAAVGINGGDVSSCSANEETRKDCLVKYQTAVGNLVDGRGVPSGASIPVKGINQQYYIQCQGLTGCVNTFRTVISNLRQEIRRADTFKKNYIVSVNGQVDKFTSARQAEIKNLNSAFRSELNKINAAMSSLGVSPTVELGNVSPETLQKDQDGLYEPPMSAVAYVGGTMDPPMLDLNPDNFSRALEGVSSQVQKLADDAKEVGQANGKLLAKHDECREEIVDRLNADQERWMNAKCQYCYEDGPLSRIESVVNALGNRADGDNDPVGDIITQTGIDPDSLCSSRSEKTEARKRLTELEGKLAAAKDKLDVSTTNGGVASATLEVTRLEDEIKDLKSLLAEIKTKAPICSQVSNHIVKELKRYGESATRGLASEDAYQAR
ncbi:MAG: hypothetical protein AB7P04_08300, partial [Bacteriovoracia bacterium]